MNGTIRKIARNGIIAAMYVVFTLLTYPVSFGLYQLRAAEMLVLLCFFRKDYAFGLTIGCAIVNLFSAEIGIIDVLFGTCATLIACLLVGFCKHLWFACLIPIVVNGFMIGAELTYFAGLNNFWVSVGFVALGELGAMILGYVLFMFFKKRPKFFELIEANQNREFRC